MKRRVLMGLQLDGKTGRAFHGSIEPTADELDVITRRQSMRVLERAVDESLELPPIERDWRYGAAAICGIFVSIGFVAALVMAMVASR